MLNNYTMANKIVISTIHQPRSDIYKLFDLILLVSQGEQIYFGKADHMIDYFSSLGYSCPLFTNPADFVLDLITVDRDNEEKETSSVNRILDLSKTFYSANRTNYLISDSGLLAIQDNETCINYNGHNMNNACNGNVNNNSNNNNIQDIELIWSDEDMFESFNNKIFENQLEVLSQSYFHGAKNSFKQFKLLLQRSLKNNWSNKKFMTVQAGEAIFMSIMIGLVYYKLPLDQKSIKDRFGLLYIIGALYPYLVILDVLCQC